MKVIIFFKPFGFTALGRSFFIRWMHSLIPFLCPLTAPLILFAIFVGGLIVPKIEAFFPSVKVIIISYS